MACEEGHLDEFPWKYWCHCTCATPKLKLESKGPGLAGLRVSCINKDCQGKEESLDGIFSKEALVRRGVTCRGRHPWVTGDPMGPCSADRKTNPRVLQRGAAGVYWAQTVSSLDIPPFSIDIAAELGKNWEDFKGKTEAEWLQLLELLNLPRKTNKPASVLLQLLREWRNASNVAEDVPFEYAEYQQLLKAHQQPVDEGAFQAESEPTPADFSAFLSGVVAAKRLREVRALEGFTRIHPPGGPFRKIRQRLQPLFHDSNEGIDWRPAVELRGEGIFLFLRDKRLREWEDDAQVQARVRDRIIRIGADLRLGEPHPADVDGLSEDERQRRFARMLLLHSLSHALMRQIALECGYGSSALRERLYVGVGTYDMAGVLIHTGSPDSEGTLGGLVREARPDLFGPLLRAALESQVWCSSDPLCITGAATLSSPRNGAACHACLLAPETSCTHFNVLLDRALLVGSDEQPELGYFRKIVP
ncbi:DUF1998 domain-containing protein [Myxococcus sp. AM001]|nr:DUF1998 domain-containing protein [Myxococcus sp. AM001]